MHQTQIRTEYREGMQEREYRITCSCGWEEKAQTWSSAQQRAGHHMEKPDE